MEKKIDAVKLQREIRSKLGEKYLRSRGDELEDLKPKLSDSFLLNRFAYQNS